MLRHIALAFCSLALLVGCASAEIGEECDTAGATDECVDGAICTNQADGAKMCRKTCKEDADCGSTEACNGISGSTTKSCQPKKK